MRTRRTSKQAGRSVRQSVTIPARLAVEVRRVAKERQLTISRALVSLAERAVEAEAAARAEMKRTYETFMTECDPVRKGEAGKDLIRAIFGKDAIAEDPGSLTCPDRSGNTYWSASPNEQFRFLNYSN